MTAESLDRVDEIRARLDASVQGSPLPWFLAANGFTVRDDNMLNVAECTQRPDAEFIAHAPADVAFLLAEVGRLTRERDFLDRHCDALGAEEVRLGRQRDEARAGAAVIAAVRALHAPREEWISPFTEARGLQCTHCRVADWPCPTVAVLPPAPEETQ